MTRRVISVWIFLLIGAGSVQAQVAPLVSEILVEQEGRVIDDQFISSLITTRPGEPLSMRAVRDTVAHLTSLNRFEDVRVWQEAAPAGIRLRYVLVPLHPVDRLRARMHRRIRMPCKSSRVTQFLPMWP
jgi:outer membrane protein assembly factor BamA